MAVYDELATGGLFDAAWYSQQNPDVVRAGLAPLDHFLRFGGVEGRAPNGWFDPAWYRAQHPEAGATGLDALLHYQREGDRHGLRPVPAFDPAWYRTAYRLPPERLALAHFLPVRGSGRYLPSPALYAVPRLGKYREDIVKGSDPFEHYRRDAEQAGRPVFPDTEVAADSGLVDDNYYLINGSDVHEAGLDPADHFCRYGWQEGRHPNIYFDTRWYLQTNPDVARLGINPLVHYVLEGEALDRRPVPWFQPGWYRRTYVVPAEQLALAHFLAHRRGQTVSPTPLFDVAWFVARHRDRLGSDRDPFAWYLQAGTLEDIDPSPGFDAAAYRRRHLGRPSRAFRNLVTPDRHNPLVHALRAQYR